MTEDTDSIDAAIAAVAPRIPQPELRTLASNERVVRTAGLKFIVKNNWKAGDVLDERTALLLNTAYQTIVINRFAPIRQALLDNPDTTYDDLDKALQDHLENFKYNPRPVDASDAKDDSRTQEERDLEAFARPHFNKAFGKQGIARADYEALLRDYVRDNRELLTKLKAQADERFNAISEDLAGVFGSDQ